MPDRNGLAILTLVLEDGAGGVLHRNFAAFVVGSPSRTDETVQIDERRTRIVRFAPSSMSDSKWSEKQWNIMDGLKVNGAGHGYFEYSIPWPAGLRASEVEIANFRAELSAKRLNGKDRKGSGKQEGDFMRGRGTHDPSLNPNSYPMTDTVPFPTSVRILAQQESLGVFELPDDPADHQGLLSWFSQKQDKHLHEAGSYGYLVTAPLTRTVLEKAEKEGKLVLRLEVDSSLPGGLAIYGSRFGRYPLDPTIVFVLK